MVRIQLASNFQVIELTYDDWATVNQEEVQNATNMVNELGKTVINDIKSAAKPKKETEDKPSEKQIAYAVELGLSKSEAKKMTKKQLWKYIQDNREE